MSNDELRKGVYKTGVPEFERRDSGKHEKKQINRELNQKVLKLNLPENENMERNFIRLMHRVVQTNKNMITIVPLRICSSPNRQYNILVLKIKL